MAMLYRSTPESASAVPAMFAPLAAVWKNTMDAAMTTCNKELVFGAKWWTAGLQQSDCVGTANCSYLATNRSVHTVLAQSIVAH